MDCEGIIQQLDTLWFFSNILSPPPPPPPPLPSPTCSDGEITQPSNKEVVEVEMGSVKPPRTVKRAPKYSSRRRYSIHDAHRRFHASMEFTEFGFRSEDIEWHSEPTLLGLRLHPCVLCKLPPLTDPKAMKRHLKSWAAAVASTVNIIKPMDFV